MGALAPDGVFALYRTSTCRHYGTRLKRAEPLLRTDGLHLDTVHPQCVHATHERADLCRQRGGQRVVRDIQISQVGEPIESIRFNLGDVVAVQPQGFQVREFGEGAVRQFHQFVAAQAQGPDVG